MPVQPELAVEEPLLSLPVIGSTATASATRDALASALEHDGGCHVDASEVESIGQATLQVLLAASRAAEQAGVPFEIINPSAPFLERVNACRLASLLGLPEEEIHS